MTERKPKPGTLPDHRIPIYDHKGNMRGHVGHTATEATVARFLGRHGATLTKRSGKHAWVGDKPPPPKPALPPDVPTAWGNHRDTLRQMDEAMAAKMRLSGKREPSPDVKNAKGSVRHAGRQSQSR